MSDVRRDTTRTSPQDPEQRNKNGDGELKVGPARKRAHQWQNKAKIRKQLESGRISMLWGGEGPIQQQQQRRRKNQQIVYKKMWVRQH